LLSSKDYWFHDMLCRKQAEEKLEVPLCYLMRIHMVKRMDSGGF
jgi:hypothetical protein